MHGARRAPVVWRRRLHAMVADVLHHQTRKNRSMSWTSSQHGDSPNRHTNVYCLRAVMGALQPGGSQTQQPSGCSCSKKELPKNSNKGPTVREPRWLTTARISIGLDFWKYSSTCMPLHYTGTAHCTRATSWCVQPGQTFSQKKSNI